MKVIIALIFIFGVSLLSGVWSFMFTDPHNQAMVGLVLVLLSLLLLRRKVER